MRIRWLPCAAGTRDSALARPLNTTWRHARPPVNQREGCWGISAASSSFSPTAATGRIWPTCSSTPRRATGARGCRRTRDPALAHAAGAEAPDQRQHRPVAVSEDRQGTAGVRYPHPLGADRAHSPPAWLVESHRGTRHDRRPAGRGFLCRTSAAHRARPGPDPDYSAQRHRAVGAVASAERSRRLAGQFPPRATLAR